MLTQSLLIAGAASLTAALSGTATVTPHEQFSSSIGVLGCHINVNRVAYWPLTLDCGESMCIQLTYSGRTLNVLHIDQSGGAYDISYDAWNTLVFGMSAMEAAHQGAGFNMTFETLPMSECADILNGTNPVALPLSAANSMNYLSNCVENDPSSWVAQNHVLYNILDPQCQFGYEEECTIDFATGQNQPTCPHQLGVPAELNTEPVYNIIYGTSNLELAT